MAEPPAAESSKSVSSLLRQLNGPAALEEKLQHARHLVWMLLHRHLHDDAAGPDSAGSNDTGVQSLQLPPLVHRHYVRTLLEWVVSQLLRSGAIGKGSKQSHALHGAAGLTADAAQQLQHLWQLAGILLHSTCHCGTEAVLVPAAAGGGMEGPVPPTIMATAASLCSQLAMQGSRGTTVADAQLAWSMCRVLELLVGGEQHSAKHMAESQASAVLLQPVATFRPTLDGTTALVSALWDGWAAVCGDVQVSGADAAAAGQREELAAAWLALACVGLRALLAAVVAHPTPKKVFQALVPQLAAPLLKLASLSNQRHEAALAATALVGLDAHSAQRPHSTPASERGLRERVASQARTLLVTLLFHETHMSGLAQALGHGAAQVLGPTAVASGRGATAAAAAAAAATKADEEEEAGQEPGVGSASSGSTRGYQAAFLQALESALGDASASHTSSLDSLPWLLSAWAAAVARQRRIESSDATAAVRQALRSSRHTGAVGDDASGLGGATSLEGAEFNMLVVLSHTLLTQLKALQAGGSAGLTQNGITTELSVGHGKKRGRGALAAAGAPAAATASGGLRVDPMGRAADLLFGMAGLLSSVKGAGAYIPTRDVSGTQRSLLTRMADAVMDTVSFVDTAVVQGSVATDTRPAHKKQKRGGSSDSGGQEEEGTASASRRADLHMAASAAVCALLELEHRALLPHLDALWTLLWRTAHFGLAGPHSTNDSTQPATQGAALRVAAAAACHLVGAFADLRQLEKLLESLLGALQGGSAGGAAGGSPAAVLITQQEVLLALRTAVRQLPPGQVAPLLRTLSVCLSTMLSGWVEAVQQAETDADGSTDTTPSSIGVAPCLMLALGALLQSTMDGVRLELSTASAVGEALAVLVTTALGPALAAALPTALREPVGVARAALLAALLGSYGSVVRLHAHCCALHPEVSPLLGLSPTGPMTGRSGLVSHAAVTGSATATTTGSAGEEEEEEAPELAEPYLAAVLASAGDAAAARKLLKSARTVAKHAGLGRGAGLLAILAQVHMAVPVSVVLSTGHGSGEAGIPDALTAPHQALALALQSNVLQAAHVVQEQLLRAQQVCVRQSDVQVDGGGFDDKVSISLKKVEKTRKRQLQQLVHLLLAPIMPASVLAEGGEERKEEADANGSATARTTRALVSLLTSSSLTSPGAPQQSQVAAGAAQSSGLAQAAAITDLQGRSTHTARSGHALNSMLASSVLATGMHTLSTLGPYAQQDAVRAWLQLLLEVHACRQAGNGLPGRVPSSVAQSVWQLLQLKEFATLPTVAACLPAALCASGLQQLRAVVHAWEQGACSEVRGAGDSKVGPAGDTTASDQVHALLKVAGKLQASQDPAAAGKKLKKLLKAQLGYLASAVKQGPSLPAAAHHNDGASGSSHKGHKRSSAQAAWDMSMRQELEKLQALLEAERAMGHGQSGRDTLAVLHAHHMASAALLLELLRDVHHSRYRASYSAGTDPSCTLQLLLACSSCCTELCADIMHEQLAIAGIDHSHVDAPVGSSKIHLQWLPQAGAAAAQYADVLAQQEHSAPHLAHVASASVAHALQAAAQLACMSSSQSTADAEQECSSGGVSAVLKQCVGMALEAGAALALPSSSEGAESAPALQHGCVSAVHAAALVHGVRAHVEWLKSGAGGHQGGAAGSGKRRAARGAALAAAAAVQGAQERLCAMMEASASAAQQAADMLSNQRASAKAVQLLAASFSACSAVLDIDVTCGGAGTSLPCKVAERSMQKAGRHSVSGSPGLHASTPQHPSLLPVSAEVECLLRHIAKVLAPESLADIAGLDDAVRWELWHQAAAALASVARWQPVSQQQLTGTAAASEEEEDVGGAGSHNDGSEHEAGSEDDGMEATGAQHLHSESAPSAGSWELQLLEVHVKAIACCCPPAQPPSPCKGGVWGLLVSDLRSRSQAAALRLALLRSLNHLLHALRAAPLRRVLQWLTARLDAISTVSGSNAAGGPHTTHAHAAALAQCAVLVLELEAGPRATQVLVSSAPALTSALCKLLQAVMITGGSTLVGGTAAAACEVQYSAAAAAFNALRGLESILGRPITFPLAPGVLPGVLGVLSTLMQAHDTCETLRRMATATGLHSILLPDAKGHGLHSFHGVLCGTASVLVAALRHRAHATRRAMPLIVACTRGMLAALVQWGFGCMTQHASGGEAQLLECASLIARLYEAVAADKQAVNAVKPYCVHMLADYITLALVSPPPPHILEEGGVSGAASSTSSAGVLPAAAAAALREGSYWLMGAIGPGELQHLHVALGPGYGGARRGALQVLRKEWEQGVKHTGKV